MTQATHQTAAQIVVPDGGRNIKFTGVLLSRVSSERRHAPRWTVMELYRTDRGMYVISRIGMSRVYHTSDCAQAVTNRLQYGHELPDGPPPVSELKDMFACEMCRPRLTDPPEQLRFERERHWGGVAENADACVAMLHREENGQRSLPWIAANLLTEASPKDKLLADAYATELI